MNKNQILTSLLLLIATLGSSQSTCDPDKPTYYAATETNIYQSANTNSAIVAKVPWKESVRVISSDGIMNPDMWVICHRGKEGYALRRFLSYDKITTEQPIRKTEVSDARQPIFDRISNLFRSSGASTIGGGLENRGGAGPTIEDGFEEQGKVVMRICVNKSGKVISAEYTQRGSTTNSRSLIRLAKKNVLRYTFNPSAMDEQCGTIAYNFSADNTRGSNDAWIEGLGAISRPRISSPPISDLIKAVGRVVVKVCVNQKGKVVFAEFDEANSTLKDIGHKQRATDYAQKIIFERNDYAPDKECGRLTFKMAKNGYQHE